MSVFSIYTVAATLRLGRDKDLKRADGLTTRKNAA